MVKILHGDGKAILTFFIGAIITIVFLASIANSVFQQTSTFDVANDTLSSTNGTTLLLLPELDGKFVTSVVVYNGSDNLIIGAGNFTIFNKHINASNNVETVKINVTASSAGGIQTQDWNISYTFQPNGYLERSVDRSVANLITIFAALSILIFAIVMFFMNGTLGRLMKGKSLTGKE